MKVFIGWSGPRSQAMAAALRDWLPLVLHYIEPWLSETDIAAGERWADAIAKELEASNFGLLCVTRENLASPWILFEAGSLAKSLSNSRVIPLLLDLEFSEISGPLAQFQSKKMDGDGMREAVQSINRSAEHAVPEERAKQLFDALWSDLQKKLEAIPAPKEAAKPVRTQHQILEELVASVRSLEAKLRDLSETTLALRSPRRRRLGRMMHPMMLADMMGTKPGDPVMLLMFASFCRDEAPWLYELTMDAYRAARAGNQAEARETLERLRRASKFLMEAPFFEEMGSDPRMMHMLLREMEHMLHHAGFGEAEGDEAEAADAPRPSEPRRKRPTKES